MTRPPNSTLTDQQWADCFGRKEGGSVYNCPVCNRHRSMVRPAPGCPTCHGSGLISDARRTAFEAAKNVTRAMTVEEMAQTLDVHVDVVRKTLRILIEKGLLEGRPLSD